MKVTNWGILGTGKIAAKFAEDLKSIGNAKLLAVGSRSQASASNFADRFNISHAYPSYQKLVQDPDIDVVYISTPHNLHKENSILCLENGKAVLCEKPIGVNTEELKEMIQVANSRNLFLMEAMWTYFLPTIKKAEEWIEDGAIGQVQHIKADFGFKAPYDPSKRLFNPELAGGALLDVGIYPLAFSLLFANSEVNRILADSVLSDTGVDLTDTYQLRFENGITADLSCSLGHQFENVGIIYGTKGFVRLPLFWKSTEAHLHGYDDNKIELFKDDRKTNGYNFEAQEVTNMLLKGKTESDVMPNSSSLNLLKQMDSIRELIHLKYPFEK